MRSDRELHDAGQHAFLERHKQGDPDVTMLSDCAAARDRALYNLGQLDRDAEDPLFDLAKRLHARNKWPTFEDCLKEVRLWFAHGDWNQRELIWQIDNGGLDPEETTDAK